MSRQRDVGFIPKNELYSNLDIKKKGKDEELSEEDEEEDFDLTKGVKIWMSYNRGLYFSIRSIQTVIAAAFSVIVLVIKSEIGGQFTGCQDFNIGSLLWILFAKHFLDLVSNILDLYGFALKNFKFQAIKQVFDVSSLAMMILVHVMFFRNLNQCSD